MGSDDEQPKAGVQDGLESSSGDPRVLLMMNAVLSTLFAAMVVWGLDVIGILTFSPLGVVFVALCLFVLTRTVI